jgi:uncharacterized membrane protein YhaH (DUF805 family)
MPYCPQCGTEISGGSFCPQCGAQIGAFGAENPYALGTQTVDSVDALGDAPEIPGFIGAMKICLGKKCVSFKGRASRSEYWFFILGYVLLLGGLSTVLNLVFTGDVARSVSEQRPGGFGSIVSSGLFLYLFFAWLTVSVRRFHDVGLPGWLFGVLFVVGNALNIALAEANNAAALNRARHNLAKFNPDSVEVSVTDPWNYLPSWFWPVLIAVILIALFNLFVFLKRGTKGPNKYGPAPARRSK